MNLPRERWINGLDALDQHGRFPDAPRVGDAAFWSEVEAGLAEVDCQLLECIQRTGCLVLPLLEFRAALKMEVQGSHRYGQEYPSAEEKTLSEIISLVWDVWSRRSVGACRRPARVVRRNWRGVGQRDALRFPEKRNENDGRKYRGLRGDGNDQRAAANAAFAFTLLGTAFDEAALQRTEIILRTGTRVR